MNWISLEDELPPRKGKFAESLKNLKWSRWIALKALDLGEVPPDAGVYQMRWAMNGSPLSINRLDGVDEDGLLYIGKAKNLKTRLKVLQRGIIRGRPTHTAVHTYMWDNFDRKFKPEQLGVRWAITPDEEIDDYEFALLGDYVEAYLDTPPLNISRGRK